MGHAELTSNELIIHSHLITYGHAADDAITRYIRHEIEELWNEPRATILISNKTYRVIFRITAAHQPDLTPETVYENTDPINNYFRIEEFASGNISFVDGIGSNTGYFKKDNLYEGSTTAAHEYGHTIGLHHPNVLDIRGQGIPGIMYPRGTLVDAPYQYNPGANAADSSNGGTMNPRFRRVRPADIALLKLPKLSWKNNRAVVGEFTSVWHEEHTKV